MFASHSVPLWILRDAIPWYVQAGAVANRCVTSRVVDVESYGMLRSHSVVPATRGVGGRAVPLIYSSRFFLPTTEVCGLLRLRPCF